MLSEHDEPEWMQWLTVFLIVDAIAFGLFTLWLVATLIVGR